MRSESAADGGCIVVQIGIATYSIVLGNQRAVRDAADDGQLGFLGTRQEAALIGNGCERGWAYCVP